MDRKQLTEQEVRSRLIASALLGAGWMPEQIREEYAITQGRIVARGGTWRRESAKFADYLLFYKPHLPLAIVEAKDGKHNLGDGLQQALEYAGRMRIPFAFSSNGAGFTFRNRLDSSEREIALDAFPSPAALRSAYKGGAFQNLRAKELSEHAIIP